MHRLCHTTPCFGKYVSPFFNGHNKIRLNPHKPPWNHDIHWVNAPSSPRPWPRNSGVSRALLLQPVQRPSRIRPHRALATSWDPNEIHLDGKHVISTLHTILIYISFFICCSCCSCWRKNYSPQKVHFLYFDIIYVALCTWHIDIMLRCAHVGRGGWGGLRTFIRLRSPMRFFDMSWC